MKSYVLCPISEKIIDEKVVRFNAAFTVALIIVFGITTSILPLVFLAVDFFMRAIDLSNFSLLKISSQGLVRYFSLKKNPINAGPKIFASRLGFMMVMVAIIASLSGYVIFAYVLAGMLGVLSLLESFFGFCLACKIYPLLYRWLYRS